MARARRGYTLVEILVTLTIGGVLTALAVPGYHAMVNQNHGSATINGLFGAVQLARQTATSFRATTTICPLHGAACGTDWSNGYLVFVDWNRDGSLDADDRVLAQVAAVPAGATLTWRSFRRRPFLQFTSRGLTHAENGSFVYCSGGGATSRTAAKIVINTAGRARHVVDDNHDGRWDDHSGPTGCPP